MVHLVLSNPRFAAENPRWGRCRCLVGRFWRFRFFVSSRFLGGRIEFPACLFFGGGYGLYCGWNLLFSWNWMGNKVGLKYLPSSPVNHHIPRGRKKNQDRSTFQYWYMSGRMFSRMSERRYSDFLMKDGIKYTFPSKIDLTNESLGKLLARAVRYSGFFGVRSVGISPLEMFLGNIPFLWKLETPPNLTRPVWWFKTWFRSSPLLKGPCYRFPPRWHHFVLEDMGGSFMKLSFKETYSLPPKKLRRVMSR